MKSDLKLTVAGFKITAMNRFNFPPFFGFQEEKKKKTAQVYLCYLQCAGSELRASEPRSP